MTLDEAIEHAMEISKNVSCEGCREEHYKLALWLMELKARREEGAKYVEGRVKY